jgi:hypothetical protein
LAAILRFRSIFTLKGALFEHDKCELRFETKRLGHSVSFSPDEHWIGSCEFDFLMLSFSLVARNGARLDSALPHFRTDNCSEQAVHSVPRFPRSLYTDVQRFGSRSVRFNAEVCCRRGGAEATSGGKDPVLILLLVAIHVCCCCCDFVCLFCMIQVPAHILCLTVASGCNKERCKPEIEITVTVTEQSSILVNLLYLLTSTTRVIIVPARRGQPDCVSDVSDQANQPLLFPPCSFVGRL